MSDMDVEASGAATKVGAEVAGSSDCYGDGGFDLNKMDPDGHCMFSSIADQNRTPPAGVRGVVCDILAANRDHFTPFIVDEDFDSYVKSIRTTNRWGGHPELAAASIAYLRPIQVWHWSDQGRLAKHALVILDLHGDEAPMNLLYTGPVTGGNHYDSLVPNDTGGRPTRDAGGENSACGGDQNWRVVALTEDRTNMQRLVCGLSSSLRGKAVSASSRNLKRPRDGPSQQAGDDAAAPSWSLNLFYTSLLNENPNSLIANSYCTLHGIYIGMDQAAAEEKLAALNERDAAARRRTDMSATERDACTSPSPSRLASRIPTKYHTLPRTNLKPTLPPVPTPPTLKLRSGT